nr:hypothetical protein [Natronorubrum bangense]
MGENAIAKRGKLPGVMDIYRTPDGEHCVTLTDHEPPADRKPLLEPLIRDGEIVRDFDLEDAATRANTDAETVGFVHPSEKPTR